MFKQESVKTEQYLRLFGLVVSNLILGGVIWITTGLSNFGYYSAEPLTEKQIMLGWVSLPACLFSTFFCSWLICKLFSTQKTWLNPILAVIVSFNLSYFSFQIIKDVYVDSGTFLYARASFSVFVAVLILMNIVAGCLTLLIFTSFYLAGKIFIRKNLP